MKFNTLYLLLAFSSCLSVGASTDQEDLDTCKRVCDEDLLPRIDAMARNHSRTISDYEDILPYWTTCQYRCYRCHLPVGIRAIKNMKTTFDNNFHFGMPGLASLLGAKDAVIHSLKWSCYTLWQNAIKDGDRNSKFA